MTLDRLAFDPRQVTKHGLIYTTLSKIRSNEQLYLLFPLCSRNFHVDFIVAEEMS